MAADGRYLRPDGGKLRMVVSLPLTNCWTGVGVTLPAASIVRFTTYQIGSLGSPVAVAAVKSPSC
jgi:hypothetical protein